MFEPVTVIFQDSNTSYEEERLKCVTISAWPKNPVQLRKNINICAWSITAEGLEKLPTHSVLERGKCK